MGENKASQVLRDDCRNLVRGERGIQVDRARRTHGKKK